jgi:hypothetical protein
MNNRFFNYILASVILTCLYHQTEAQSIQAEAKLQQYTIRIGDQTKLFLSVHQPANVHINFPKFTDTIISKVQVVSTNKPDTAYDANDRSNLTVIQSYTITSFDAGTYSIPPMSIGSEKDVVKTNEVTLQVQTVKVDTTKGIYDIKQPLQVSYTFMDWLHDNWYWIVIPIVVIALAIGLILYFKSKPKKAPVVKVVKAAVPPHIVALDQLKALRDKKLWQNEQVKQYYIELSDILREYLEKRYAIKTHEKTTDEIFDGLKHMSITDDNRNRLRRVLVLSDLVKFAKEHPLPADNEFSIDNALDFVVKTQQYEKPEGGAPNV